MAAPCYQGPTPNSARSRIRVAIAEYDPVRRSRLRAGVLRDTTFDLVAEATSSEECVGMVERELPEVVIGSLCDAAYLDAQQAFPVLIKVGGSGSAVPTRLVRTIPLPLRETEVAAALAMATSRVMQIKAGELLSLTRSYLAYGDVRRTAVNRITMEAGGRQDSLGAEDILWVRAVRNYVHLHTQTGTFEVRDTLGNLATKLESCGFTRIHRGIVVNTEAIQQRVFRNGAVVGIALRDGTRLRVGRMFRDRLAVRTENQNS